MGSYKAVMGAVIFGAIAGPWLAGCSPINRGASSSSQSNAPYAAVSFRCSLPVARFDYGAGFVDLSGVNIGEPHRCRFQSRHFCSVLEPMGTNRSPLGVARWKRLFRI